MKGRLPSKVIFRQRSFSIKGHLPSKVILRQRLSFVNGCLLTKFVFRQRSSSVKDCFLSKVIFCQRSSSIKSHLPVHCCYSCLVSESSKYKLGCLDKVLVLKFVLKPSNQPRYRVQDGSWPNHKSGRKKV